MSRLRAAPIGVFDSGVGGLTVVLEIQRLLPGEDIVYFADTANFPYGVRSPHELVVLSVAASRFLVRRGAKAIVVACNTASSAALAPLRAVFDVPFVGMVPGIKPASAATRAGKIGVLATEATVSGQIMAELVEAFADGVSVVAQACSELTELVEMGEVASERTRAVLRRYLEPMLAEGVDTLVLGCTHYPFLRPCIAEIAGDGVQIIDTGGAVARQLARVLEQHQLDRRRQAGGVVEYHVSGDRDAFMATARRLVAIASGQ